MYIMGTFSPFCSHFNSISHIILPLYVRIYIQRHRYIDVFLGFVFAHTSRKNMTFNSTDNKNKIKAPPKHKQKKKDQLITFLPKMTRIEFIVCISYTRN